MPVRNLKGSKSIMEGLRGKTNPFDSLTFPFLIDYQGKGVRGGERLALLISIQEGNFL